MLTALMTPRILTREVLAGLVVALALIPEAISFSIIAGVDPKLGLFSSFIMAVTIAFVGGRPAMITAATGAVARVVAPVVRDYGMDYFIATVLLAGVLQIVLAVCGVAKLMRFIPRSVMVGFVNALAILIFAAQLPQLIGVPWMVYPLVAVGLVILVLLPKVTTAIPAPLVSVTSSSSPPRSWSSRLMCPPWVTRVNCPGACRSCSSRTCPWRWRRCGSSPPTRLRWLWWVSWSRS